MGSDGQRVKKGGRAWTFPLSLPPSSTLDSPSQPSPAMIILHPSRAVLKRWSRREEGTTGAPRSGNSPRKGSALTTWK